MRTGSCGGTVMAEIERLTINLSSDMAVAVNGAVVGGDYASSSEVVRAAFETDIDKGLADAAAGRVTEFDTNRIIERGKTLLAGRSPSA